MRTHFLGDVDTPLDTVDLGDIFDTDLAAADAAIAASAGPLPVLTVSPSTASASNYQSYLPYILFALAGVILFSSGKN